MSGCLSKTRRTTQTTMVTFEEGRRFSSLLSSLQTGATTTHTVHEPAYIYSSVFNFWFVYNYSSWTQSLASLATCRELFFYILTSWEFKEDEIDNYSACCTRIIGWAIHVGVLPSCSDVYIIFSRRFRAKSLAIHSQLCVLIFTWPSCWFWCTTCRLKHRETGMCSAWIPAARSLSPAPTTPPASGSC